MVMTRRWYVVRDPSMNSGKTGRWGVREDDQKRGKREVQSTVVQSLYFHPEGGNRDWWFKGKGEVPRESDGSEVIGTSNDFVLVCRLQ